MTTSYLSRRSLLEGGRADVDGQPIEILVSVEERVERGLVIVAAGDQQPSDCAGGGPSRSRFRRQRDRVGGGPFGPSGERGDEGGLVHRRQVVAQGEVNDTSPAVPGNDDGGDLPVVAGSLGIDGGGGGNRLGIELREQAPREGVGRAERARHAPHDRVVGLRDRHLQEPDRRKRTVPGLNRPERGSRRAAERTRGQPRAPCPIRRSGRPPFRCHCRV